MFEDNKQTYEQNKERMVTFRRFWNDSMCVYHDYMEVWDKNKVHCISLGVNFFDVVKPEIDQNSRYYKEWKENMERKEREHKKKMLQDGAEFYLHHGILTAYKIAMFLQTINNKDLWYSFHNLLKVKKFRSGFRESLCNQVLEWIRSPECLRKYPFPLSKKQMRYL